LADISSYKRNEPTIFIKDTPLKALTAIACLWRQQTVKKLLYTILDQKDIGKTFTFQFFVKYLSVII